MLTPTEKGDTQGIDIFRLFVWVVLVFLFTTGCTTNKDFKRIDTLRRDPAWPKIRAAAEIEIARREGNTDWSYCAYYEPKAHTNGAWAVTAYAPYPSNRLGDWIDILIRDNGETISYSPHLSWHAK